MKTTVIAGWARSVSYFAVGVCLAASGLVAPAYAEDDMTEAATETVPVTAGAQVFEPAYFSQFAPRSALDMVERIPGFSISGGNDNGQRGLGQANQNVIVNGERFSSKSDSLEDQLRRIPAADVVRIEIVDGNSLNIPGLTGQVANVIYQNSGASGQFRWNTGFRPHNTEAQLYGGEASITGTSGALDFTVSLSNDNDRFGADGPILITDGSGGLIEAQRQKFSGKFDNPKLATAFAYDFGNDVLANLNLSYGLDYFKRDEPEVGSPVSGPVRTRESKVSENGPQYEIGADLQFPLGPGTLKLIGLERFERDNFTARLVDSFDDGSPSTGSRFKQTNGIGERIGRFEYGWGMLGGDWQLSGEAAFNRLDRTSSLFTLDPAGEFVRLDFPQGNGGVTEDRYETSLSFSRSLSSSLSIQAIGSMEFSKIEQTGSAANSRSFKRPKGSFAATWKPADGFDLSVTVARRVSQLSFGDFLASVNLNNDNQNGGNNELVPYQSWNLEVEANKTLGPWGSIKLEARQAWFEDFIDWFPLPNGGEARGNIGDADRLHLEANLTLNMDPLGWKGARFDIQAVKRYMNVTDPFTGEERGFSFDQEGALEIDFRHDIPSSDWAWGARLSHFDSAPYARRSEEGRDWEGPFFGTLFVEHKDVFGLTVQARAGNLLGARNHFRRTVYDGPRPDAPILFHEDANRRIGPIFRFIVSGSF
ncbi:TonB-dependent receptor plug domain-containing protein [Altererythrobacter arenosus]|uniref:TonB-dependent receptor plug domain-containing protein n=1 Tax=Altererythrobacter arenosus TaxID=3032592 RepID=A0ABY8FTH1_9SPHN|nr:TonB-dependent receptor plug domain-containing protein [Altererythrobacter sp. CAU 1644]WFL78122.1 TonB-dependent receptor plug domain-containing protein [Altererythrobacter sp. CAU 1644]